MSNSIRRFSFMEMAASMVRSDLAVRPCFPITCPNSVVATVKDGRDYLQEDFTDRELCEGIRDKKIDMWIFGRRWAPRFVDGLDLGHPPIEPLRFSLQTG
jgi:hypothetical protein